MGEGAAFLWTTDSFGQPSSSAFFPAVLMATSTAKRRLIRDFKKLKTDQRAPVSQLFPNVLIRSQGVFVVFTYTYPIFLRFSDFLLHFWSSLLFCNFFGFFCLELLRTFFLEILVELFCFGFFCSHKIRVGPVRTFSGLSQEN